VLLLHSPLDFLPAPGFVVVLAGAYVFPSFVAIVKRGPRWPLACAVNIGLGWTIIGWVLALAWAVSDGKDTPPHQGD